MITKITTAELTIGMYIHTFPGSWADHPFIKNTFKVKSLKQIDTIKSHGINEVFIDTDKGLPAPSKAAPEVTEATSTNPPKHTKAAIPTKKVNRQAAIEKAKMVCTEAKQCVNTMFNEVRMGKAIDLPAINPVVKSIVSSVELHADALLSVARLKTQSDYTYMHSVAVCGLMVALAKKLKLNDAQVQIAGLAGLLHDVGKVAMQDDILNKPGKLTDSEYKIIQSHTTAGYKILKRAEMNKSVLDVCLHHHEKMDGSGYPDKLENNDISLLARMGAICDVYDAVTSTRPYNEGWDPALALKRMASWEGHFDKKIFSTFVQCLGIYPVGSLVKISSGHLAIITEQNESSLVTPHVKVFYSIKCRQMCPIKMIDLSKSSNTVTIESIENPQNWNLNVPPDFWA